MIQSSLHRVNDGYDVGIWLAIFDLFNTHKEKIWVSWGYVCTGNYWSGAARWFRQLDGRKPSTRRTFDGWCCRTRESMQRWSLDCGCLRASGKFNGAKMHAMRKNIKNIRDIARIFILILQFEERVPHLFLNRV